MARKKKEPPKGAPEWMVTFGDLMSLLLTFFVLLLSLSEIKSEQKFQDVMQSIRAAFGYVGGIGAIPTTVPPKISLVKRLETIVIPKKPRNIGDSEDEGIEGKVFRVTDVREGLQITVCGKEAFDRFSAKIPPESDAATKGASRSATQNIALIV